MQKKPCFICENLRNLRIKSADWAELEKLKGPLAEFQPVWFAYVCGVER